MTASRQLRLNAFMRPATIHTGAWRYPGAFPDANFNFAHLKRFAQTLERGRFDAFFMADHLAVLNMPMEALKRSATVTSFDPLTLLPALAVPTEAERAGLHVRPFADPPPALTIALVWRRRSPIAAALRKVAGTVRAAYPNKQAPPAQRRARRAKSA